MTSEEYLNHQCTCLAPFTLIKPKAKFNTFARAEYNSKQMTQQNTLLQITRYGMGDGDKELSVKLITNYFKLMIEDNRWPKIITFYNEGVKLLTADHAVTEHFKTLEAKGVKLMACTTCLEHYHIADQMAVGIKGTMMDIITLQANADKVINL